MEKLLVTAAVLLAFVIFDGVDFSKETKRLIGAIIIGGCFGAAIMIRLKNGVWQ